MMQKTWFKLFIWFVTTAFFFVASTILISVYSPAPSEQKAMLFMSGMMDAMHNSLMGLSMSLEGDTNLSLMVKKAADLTLPLILVSIIGALAIKLRRSYVDK